MQLLAMSPLDHDLDTPFAEIYYSKNLYLK